MTLQTLTIAQQQHQCDPDAFDGWMARASLLCSTDAEAIIGRARWSDQVAAVRAAYDAVGQAYRAAGIPPSSDLVWRLSVNGYWGAVYGPDDEQIYHGTFSTQIATLPGGVLATDFANPSAPLIVRAVWDGAFGVQAYSPGHPLAPGAWTVPNWPLPNGGNLSNAIALAAVAMRVGLTFDAQTFTSCVLGPGDVDHDHGDWCGGAPPKAYQFADVETPEDPPDVSAIVTTYRVVGAPVPLGRLYAGLRYDWTTLAVAFGSPPGFGSAEVWWAAISSAVPPLVWALRFLRAFIGIQQGYQSSLGGAAAYISGTITTAIAYDLQLAAAIGVGGADIANYARNFASLLDELHNVGSVDSQRLIAQTERSVNNVPGGGILSAIVQVFTASQGFAVATPRDGFGFPQLVDARANPKLPYGYLQPTLMDFGQPPPSYDPPPIDNALVDVAAGAPPATVPVSYAEIPPARPMVFGGGFGGTAPSSAVPPATVMGTGTAASTGPVALAPVAPTTGLYLGGGLAKVLLPGAIASASPAQATPVSTQTPGQAVPVGYAQSSPPVAPTTPAGLTTGQKVAVGGAVAVGAGGILAGLVASSKGVSIARLFGFGRRR